MYLYSFSQYAGYDKVFFLPKKNLKFKPGDLIQQDQHFYLVLWEAVSFQELYTTVYRWTTNFQLVYPKLLKEPTLQLLHRMTYQWYSTYKNAIKLFLDSDISRLITKEEKKIWKKRIIDFLIGEIKIQNKKWGQILLIFPDLWTITNTILPESVDWLLLNSLATQSRKNTNRRKIKTWKEKLIFSTSAGIFQDFEQLEKIYLIEPDKRYYASQQDPRYKVWDVVNKMSQLYNAELEIINSKQLGLW